MGSGAEVVPLQLHGVPILLCPHYTNSLPSCDRDQVSLDIGLTLPATLIH